ncbi:hypothetical protein Tco_0213362 [Tanacetum coccineum]
MGISDDTCDVPVYENSSTFDALKNHSLILSDSNDDGTSSVDDDFEDIEYVEASPPDSELVSLEESPSYFLSPGADSDSFFEEFNTSLSYSVNSLPEFKTFSDHKEETSSGSTTTHVDNSLPEYDLFHFEIELDQGELTNVVMETIFGEPRVHMLNIFALPTPWNSEFTPFRTFPWVTIIMAPKQMTQAAIAKLVSDEVAKALAADRATRGENNAAGAGRTWQRGSFMTVVGPTQFHGKEGAIELCRWFEKMESTFGISECAERNKVKFAAATLQGKALTWWNTQVATLGLAEANGKSWDDMKMSC